jgi:lysophospholipase L1-like esterase
MAPTPPDASFVDHPNLAARRPRSLGRTYEFPVSPQDDGKISGLTRQPAHVDGEQDMNALSRLRPRTAAGRVVGTIAIAATLVLLAASSTVLVPARYGPAKPLAHLPAACPSPARGSHPGGQRAAPRPDQGGGQPVLAVVGASFSAGVGAHPPGQAWPADLGRILHWRVDVSADPGAGYTNPGAGHRGPFTTLAAGLDLASLRPAVLLIQGGHNDIGQPLPRISRTVRALLDQIRCQSPTTRIGIVTVFAAGNRPSPAAIRTNETIVAAARQADPQVMVFDPLTEHWQFPRVGDQLHPDAAGHQWIAARVAAGLGTYGVPGIARPTPSATAPAA